MRIRLGLIATVLAAAAAASGCQSTLDRRRDLRSFVRYIFENAETIADEALFVPLNEAESERQMQKFIAAIS
jgi:hypothetical protein